MKHILDYGTGSASGPTIMLHCSIAITSRQAHSEAESKVPVGCQTPLGSGGFFTIPSRRNRSLYELDDQRPSP
jgi:hypothetical protein